MDAEDGSQDGCIFWTDERGVRWCKDVSGFYGGVPGSLFYVCIAPPASLEEGGGGQGSEEEVWVAYDADLLKGGVGDGGGPELGEFTFAARGGSGYRHEEGEEVREGGGDGAIYWRDEQGLLWCRDRLGVYGGGEGEEYYSWDGGSVWYGQGEAWVEFSEDALEFLAATSARKQRAKTVARSVSFKRDPSGADGLFPVRPLSAGGCNSENGSRVSRTGLSWENERGVMDPRPRDEGGEARYRALYGAGAAGVEAVARVRAEEARLNMAFDRCLAAAAAPLWPEMPLRL